MKQLRQRQNRGQMISEYVLVTLGLILALVQFYPKFRQIVEVRLHQTYQNLQQPVP